MKKCLTLLVLGIVLPGGFVWQTSAQDLLEQRPAESTYWINGGFGPAKPGFGLGLTGSYRTGLHIFSARFLYSSEVAILSDHTEFAEGAILSGLASSTTYGLISLEAGIGFVSGSWDLSGQYEIESFTAIGLPVAVQLFWTPTEKLGIGLYGFANFNSKENMGGLLFCLQLINFAG